MIKRAVFARELGVPIVMHDYLTGSNKKKTWRNRTLSQTLLLLRLLGFVVLVLEEVVLVQ
jgi:hypothetical protein